MMKRLGDVFFRILLLAAVLIGLNYLFFDHFSRLDLTKDQRFSLSSETIEILGNLKDLISVDAYISRDLPSQFLPLTRDLNALLEEYRAYGRGKIQLTIHRVNPSEKNDMMKYLKKIGIPVVEVQAIGKDKLEIKKAVLGITIKYADKTEVIPLVQSNKTLEYDITSKIVRAAREKSPSVGILQGQGLASDKAYGFIQKALEENFIVEDILPQELSEKADSISLLWVREPSGLPDTTVRGISTYLARGGKLFLTLSGLFRKDLSAMQRPTGMEGLLSLAGIQLNPDMIADRSNAMATFRQGFFQMSVQYPFFVSVLRQNFDTSFPAIANIRNLVLPWTGSMNLKSEAGNRYWVLARSTPYSRAFRGFVKMNPNRRLSLPDQEHPDTPFILAIASIGKFSKLKKEMGVSDSSAGQMVVVSDENFVQNAIVRQYPQNLGFFLNLVDWLNGGQSLTNLRSRAASARPLDPISDEKKQYIKVGFTYIYPLFILFLGLIRFWRQSRLRGGISVVQRDESLEE